MRAYLIDPSLHRIAEIELPDDVRASLAVMRKIIGCQTLGGGMISDMHDQLWCDDIVFCSRSPCFAFKLCGHGADMGPFGGKCIITGADRYGNNAPPTPALLQRIKQDIVWLDEIVPSIDWVEDHQEDITKFSVVMTYSRSAKT